MASLARVPGVALESFAGGALVRRARGDVGADVAASIYFAADRNAAAALTGTNGTIAAVGTVAGALAPREAAAALTGANGTTACSVVVVVEASTSIAGDAASVVASCGVAAVGIVDAIGADAATTIAVAIVVTATASPAGGQGVLAAGADVAVTAVSDTVGAVGEATGTAKIVVAASAAAAGDDAVIASSGTVIDDTGDRAFVPGWIVVAQPRARRAAAAFRPRQVGADPRARIARAS